MSEIAEDVQEGLVALAVGTGLQVMTAMMNADVEAVCGPKGKHIPIDRPRMRASDETGELPVPCYELFSQTEVLGRMAMARMLGGLSTRRYPAGLERLDQDAS